MKRFSLIYSATIAYRGAIFSSAEAMFNEMLGPILAKMALKNAVEIAGSNLGPLSRGVTE